MDSASWSLRWSGVIALAFAIVIFFALRSFWAEGAVLQMRLHADRDGVAQWFFDAGRGFGEGDSVSAPLHVGVNEVQFRFPAGTYRALRFDPINNDARVVVEDMRWTATADMMSIGVDRLVAAANVASVTRTDEGIEILPSTGTGDPQTALVLPAPLRLMPLHSSARDAILALALAAGLLLFHWLIWKHGRTRLIVIVALSAAAVLIGTMAARSRVDVSVHPDELSHYPAYQYYLDHYLPPAVDDAATIPSTSPWGYSYLDELDVVYAIAARVTAPFAAPTANLYTARAFQIGLWLLLILLAAMSRRWALTLSVLLLSPQLWYVFSYFNGDAFPLFLALILAGMVGRPDGGLRDYLDGTKRWTRAAGIVAVCLGLLLVSKRNYLPIVPAFALWLATIHIHLGSRAVCALLLGLFLIGSAIFLAAVPRLHAAYLPMLVSGGILIVVTALLELRRCLRSETFRVPLLRLLFLLAASFAIAAPRVGWDLWVNGTPATKNARLNAVVEARAMPQFKPSAIARHDAYPTLVLASQGVPLQGVVFAPYFWLRNTFLSAFGIYGYGTIFADLWLYVALGGLSLTLAISAFVALRRTHPREWPAVMAIFLGISLLVAVSSLLLSWVSALQSQGRYLFPIFALLSLLLATGADRQPERLTRVVILIAAIMSAASFAFVALPHLAVP